MDFIRGTWVPCDDEDSPYKQKKKKKKKKNSHHDIFHSSEILLILKTIGFPVTCDKNIAVIINVSDCDYTRFVRKLD